VLKFFLGFCQVGGVMKLFIGTVQGEVFEVSVAAADTLGRLKSLIQEREAVHTDFQQLLLGKSQLSDDSKSLRELGLGDGSRVTLLVLQDEAPQMPTGFGSSSLFGDFYSAESPITRGVSMPTTFHGRGMEHFGGDCYTMPDVVRGVTCNQPSSLDVDFTGGAVDSQGFSLDHKGSGTEAFGGDYYARPDLNLLGQLSDLHFGAAASSAPVMESSAEPSLHIPRNSQGSLQATTQSSNPRFSNNDLALRVPVDAFFTFEVTTLVVVGASPSGLMNSFLDFLTSEVVASILKVRQPKCSIKVDVFIDNVMCTLKARCYQLEPAKLALEIQRRKGDPVVFGELYDQASNYLQRRFSIERGMPLEPHKSSSSDSGVPSLPTQKLDLEDVRPFLDMARHSQSPQLQAEAAVALAALIQNANSIDILCSDSGAIADIAKLLEKEQLCIALPVAQLMLELAQGRNAAEHFRELLPKLLEKVRCLHASPSSSASSLAGRQYGQALAIATQSCKQQLSQETTSKLASDMADLMSATSNSAVYGPLQEAYVCLKAQ